MAGRTAIGLDIGSSVVRVAELSVGRAGVTLERFGQVVLPEGVVVDGEVVEGDVVAEHLRRLWSAVRPGHRRVVIGVANQRVLVRQVELPWMPPKELKASLGMQVTDLLPFPVDTAVLDFHPLEEVSDGSRGRRLRGLLVAAGRGTVQAAVDCATRAGLRVDAVDLTPFAVLRSMGRRTGPDVETEAIVDVGARVTNVVVHSAGVPRFVRILVMGGQDVTDAVCERLGVPAPRAEALKQSLPRLAEHPGLLPPEQLEELRRAVDDTARDFVDEVGGSLDYYAASTPQARIQRILLCGGGARLEGLAGRLAAEARVPVQLGDPMAHLRMGRTGLGADQLEFVRPLTAVPVGLALGAL